jgi:hypothetical protein
MTTPTSLPPPPFGDDTDAAISARLDGELAAFAAEHDTTEAAVEIALDGWPGTAGRVDALERARAAVAAPVPPLDEVTRRRLVQGALGSRDDALPTAPTSRAPRGAWLGLAAAAVLVILVVVAIGAMVVTDGGGTDQADGGGSSASVAGRAPDGDIGDVGDVSDPAALRALLEGRDATTNEKAADAVPPAAGTPGAEAGGAGGESADQRFRDGEGSGALAARNAVNPDVCAAQLAGDRPVRFVGTGIYGGLPVVVVGIDQGGRSIAFVVPVGDCTTVLTSVSR